MKNGTLMTQIKQIFAEKISGNQHNQRHLRAIVNNV